MDKPFLIVTLGLDGTLTPFTYATQDEAETASTTFDQQVTDGKIAAQYHGYVWDPANRPDPVTDMLAALGLAGIGDDDDADIADTEDDDVLRVIDA